MEKRVDYLEEVLLCLGVFVAVSYLKFSGLVLMSSEPGKPFNQDSWGTGIVIRDVYIDVYKIDIKEGKFNFTQSSLMGLINKKYQTVDLVYILGFKLKHRKKIVIH